MFARAGHRVRTKRALSNVVWKEADVIVWAPDDFDPPPPPVIDWFDQWLQQGGRTLIYVGRDFDAAPGYYDQVIPTAPGTQVRELRRRRTEARLEQQQARRALPASADCPWFQIDNQQRLRTVNRLEGPFSEGVEADDVGIELRSRLRPKIYRARRTAGDDPPEGDPSGQAGSELLLPEAAEVLLRSGGDILISQQRHDQQPDSYLILVANGSFLLNLPLVNHQHRRLAAQLVDQFPPPQTVVFLESTADGPPITGEEPAVTTPTGLSLFAQRPLDVILFHLVAWGIILCLARWPIFGRPARAPRPAVSDFGRHVAALGTMLRKTGNRDYAQASWQHYHQQVVEGGKGRAGERAPAMTADVPQAGWTPSGKPPDNPPRGSATA
ncbi:MAG: hypothetical protein GTO03_06070 [Planctomycetales bacterium]|nr:hypothetical protein [Planctomycetales bacterium]